MQWRRLLYSVLACLVCSVALTLTLIALNVQLSLPERIIIFGGLGAVIGWISGAIESRRRQREQERERERRRQEFYW